MNDSIQMMKSGKEAQEIEVLSPRHKWKNLDGNKIQSKFIFPPFKGIILEDERKRSKASLYILLKKKVYN